MTFRSFHAIKQLLFCLDKREGLMHSMNIVLPETMKKFVESKLASGGYDSVSAYVRSLIRDDEKRAAHEELEAKLEEGLRSRKKTVNAQVFTSIRKRAKARLARKTSKKSG